MLYAREFKMHGTQDFSQTTAESITSGEITVAVIGGGPGGLFTAWSLESKLGALCKVVVLEASDRAGGKIVTGQIGGTGIYEAGVAEIYDYSALGFDPLRQLIEGELGLPIQHIRGGGCVLRGKIVPSVEDLAPLFGQKTLDAVLAFRAKCASLVTPGGFYQSARSADNAHPWARRTGEDILANEIDDDIARQYIRVMVHSDVAAPPHLTTGLNLLKNVLMDVPGYIDIYSVGGGNESIVEKLEEQLDSELRLDTMVQCVSALPNGRFRLDTGHHDHSESFEADYVVAALPLSALAMIDWRDGKVQHAIDRHMSRFDTPGHYLRVTMLFEKPFWRDHLSEAWWMIDAFGGCCVYDEGARHDMGSWGALGFLIPGNAALAMANMSDERIENLCIDALPAEFGDVRKLVVDRRVHRWMASVNAIPGGMPVRGLTENHQPAPVSAPGLFVVGDYLFDSTLNGVLDSAEAAADLVTSDILIRRRNRRLADDRSFAPHRAALPAQQALGAAALADAIAAVWTLPAGARILEVGAGAGARVAALRALGFDAHGLEMDPRAHAATPRDLARFNLYGDALHLPHGDASFDIVIENCLCRLPARSAPDAAREMRRVARRGLAVASVTSDLPLDLIERHDLLDGVETLSSRWAWSEHFSTAGFGFALSGKFHLEAAWDAVAAAHFGPGLWFEEAESFSYSFYDCLPGEGAAKAAPEPVRREHATAE